jgi:hypothetical protein
VPSVFTPQATSNPALTWLNVPEGGAAWLYWLFPQHASVASERMPQVKSKPALTLSLNT